MPLVKEKVPVSFSQGVDTKTDQKQVVIGKMLLLENAVFTSANEFTKRFGYVGLAREVEGSATPITQGSALMSFKKEILQFTGNDLYSYSDSIGRWSEKGSATSVDLQSSSVVRNTYQQTVPDSAYHPVGLKVYAWEDSRGGSRYCVIDSNTEQTIVSDSLIDANAVKPKVLAVGAYVVIIYLDTVSDQIELRSINANSPSVISTATVLGTTVNATDQFFDACKIGERLFVAWNGNNGGGAINAKYIDSVLVLSAELTVASESASECIGLFGDETNQQLWVAYHNGTAVKYFVTDYSLGTTLIRNPTSIETVADIVNVTGYADSGSATVYYEKTAAQTYNYLIRKNTANTAGTVGTAAVFMRSVGLAGKAFFYNGRQYLVVTHSSALQPTYFLVNENAFVVAKVASLNGGGLSSQSALSSIQEVEEGIFLFPYLQKESLTVVSGAAFTQTGVQAGLFDFTSKNTYLRAELANNLHVVGGFLAMYDGEELVEHGFHLFPENVSCATNTAGGSIGDGTYQYFVVYEWTDNQGQLHRSAPSIAVSQVTTGGGTSTNTLTIPTLRITAKTDARSPVSIAVYRTQNGLSIPYRISSVTSPLLNNTSADTVTYVDTAADSTIIGNEILYTTGSVLENIAPPAVALITIYKNRVIVVPSESRTSYWLSKQVIPGSPAEFSDFLIKNVNQRGGDITAVAEMDDKLVFFKRDFALVTAWDGPADTGANDDVTDPIEIPMDAGCINPRSVVKTPKGLMFQSSKGIYILTRSLEVAYLGAEVEAYNNEVITSGQVVPDTNQVRFTTESGVALVYDYFFNQWSVFSNHFAVDATVFQNRFSYLTAEGTVMKESHSTFTDNGEFVPLKWRTGWLSFAQLQGFMRVYRLLLLGDYKSPHQLLVQVAYDFNDSFVQSSYIDAEGIMNPSEYGDDEEFGDETPYGGNFPLYQFRLNLARQKCTAVMIQGEDVQTSDLGEGYSISGLTFLVGAKQGLNKLGSARVSG
jgi:hypothetical protein